MKVIAYTALHYGKAYLGYAIRSIIDHVDEYHVLYSAVGSHGSRTDRQCPDTRAELLGIAQVNAGNKLQWHDGEWAHEGLQRDAIHTLVPDADVIIVLDADEIWPDGMAERIVQYPETVYVVPHYLRIPIIHYWRSFYRCVLHDPAYPVRAIYPKRNLPDKQTATDNMQPTLFINHMGYAQKPDVTEYKQYTHGHKGEWDWTWFENKFMPNAQQLVHPVGSEYWNPETIDPWDYLPDFMRDHPYANMDVIGQVTDG